MHSGEKSSKCLQCDFASSQASDLRRRLKTHSGGCRQFKETFENTQWRKVKHMQPVLLCIISCRQFKCLGCTTMEKECNLCDYGRNDKFFADRLTSIFWGTDWNFWEIMKRGQISAIFATITIDPLYFEVHIFSDPPDPPYMSKNAKMCYFWPLLVVPL